MRIKPFVLCSILLLTAGHYDASAQGFFGKLKNVTKQIEKKVGDALDKTTPKTKVTAPKSKKNSDLEKRVDAMVGA